MEQLKRKKAFELMSKRVINQKQFSKAPVKEMTKEF
jgi:hypothetical protein